MALQINSAPLSQWSLGLHNDFHNQNNSLILAAGAAKLYLEKLSPEYAFCYGGCSFIPRFVSIGMFYIPTINSRI